MRIQVGFESSQLPQSGVDINSSAGREPLMAVPGYESLGYGIASGSLNSKSIVVRVPQIG